jgi:hypothetical protein
VPVRGTVELDRKRATTESHQITEEQRLPQEPRLEGADDFFREVNARILELGKRFGFQEERLELICECEDAACTERVCISAEKFAELRDAAGLHLVAAGHSHAGHVVGSGKGYLVVAD